MEGLVIYSSYKVLIRYIFLPRYIPPTLFLNCICMWCVYFYVVYKYIYVPVHAHVRPEDLELAARISSRLG